MIVRM